MTDLTDKWKNGELKWHKSYYCKNKKGDVCLAIFMDDGNLYSKELGGTLDFKYWEVLDTVPSFKELQSLKAQLAEHKEYCCCLKNEVLLLKIMELKELLKECMDMFVKMYSTNTVNSAFLSLYENIKAKIEEVLK